VAKTTEAPKARKQRSDVKPELKSVMFRITKDQDQTLRAEAFKRAADRDQGQPDKSEVLRELLDAWIARRR